MINDEAPPTEPPDGYHRIWNDTFDPLGFYGDPDPVAHSPAALRYLMQHGQDAYLRWVDHVKAARTPSDAPRDAA